MERRAGWLATYWLDTQAESWPQLNERGLLACLPACLPASAAATLLMLLLLPVFSPIHPYVENERAPAQETVCHNCTVGNISLPLRASGATAQSESQLVWSYPRGKHLYSCHLHIYVHTCRYGSVVL
jgi:hypothetical protein